MDECVFQSFTGCSKEASTSKLGTDYIKLSSKAVSSTCSSVGLLPELTDVSCPLISSVVFVFSGS